MWYVSNKRAFDFNKSGRGGRALEPAMVFSEYEQFFVRCIRALAPEMTPREVAQTIKVAYEVKTALVTPFVVGCGLVLTPSCLFVPESRTIGSLMP